MTFRSYLLCVAAAAAVCCAPAALAGDAPASPQDERSSPAAKRKLRPTFMGTAYDIVGGEYDGKRGYLFRIWNESGKPVRRGRLPGRFDQRRKVLAVLATGAAYSDGTLSFEDRGTLGEELFADSTRERLNPSPSGAFADRPANIIVVVEPEVDRLVYTLQGRTATASYAAAAVETLNLGGDSEVDGLPPHPGEDGKATLLGIDSNGNGVRDDVEIAIAELYPDEPAVRAYQMEGARSLSSQLEISASGSPETAKAYVNSRAGQVWTTCLVYHEAENDLDIAWSGHRLRELRTLMLNTRERTEAFDDFDELLRGGVVIRDSGIRPEDCIDLMEVAP